MSAAAFNKVWTLLLSPEPSSGPASILPSQQLRGWFTDDFTVGVGLAPSVLTQQQNRDTSGSESDFPDVKCSQGRPTDTTRPVCKKIYWLFRELRVSWCGRKQNYAAVNWGSMTIIFMLLRYLTKSQLDAFLLVRVWLFNHCTWLSVNI